jgi:hypothetical protein
MGMLNPIKNWKVEYFNGPDWVFVGNQVRSQLNFESEICSFASANNNENFAVRILTDGTPGSSAGTMSIDMFNVSGTATSSVPEPGSLLALASGLVGFVGFVAKRRLA